MNSIKTKTQNYTLIHDEGGLSKAIGAVVLVPENGQFRAYVAWEWEKQAREGNFAIIESQTLIDKNSMAEFINNIADYGNDVTHKSEIRKLFGNFF